MVRKRPCATMRWVFFVFAFSMTPIIWRIREDEEGVFVRRFKEEFLENLSSKTPPEFENQYFSF